MATTQIWIVNGNSHLILHKTQTNSFDIENYVSHKVPQGTLEPQGGFAVDGLPAGIAFISRNKGYQLY